MNTKIVGDTLYVNGEKFVDKLPRPSPRDIFFMSLPEKKRCCENQVYYVTICTRTWQQFCSKVCQGNLHKRRKGSLQGCSVGPRHCFGKPRNRRDCSISRDGAVTDEGFNDDGDFGMGRKAPDAIQNLQMKYVVVFVVRQFGGTHLGPKRFQIVEKLVEESLKALESD